MFPHLSLSRVICSSHNGRALSLVYVMSYAWHRTFHCSVVSVGMETSFSCVLRSAIESWVAGGIVTELWSSPSTAITLFPWAGVTHTKGHRLLRLERSIGIHSPLQAVSVCHFPCVTVESHDGCRYSCKECVQDLTPHHCCLMYLLIKPSARKPNSLCSPLCQE